ncbi:MAG: FlgN protein [Clostridia bacterium]|jgi:flagellar biosynthesis/type III secretory pathway chaperone|nr:FlgN protein [Clostridia bacterium]
MIDRQAEKIIDILNKENGHYKDLLELSNKKKNTVIEGKVSELDKIVKFEQNLIFDLGQLEKLREQELQKLCEMLGVNGKTNVSEIIKHLPEPLAQKLLELQKSLGNTISELQNVNNINGQLIQQSLDYIEYSVNMITSTGPTNSVYSDLKGTGKGMDNKKRLFDTKA